MRQLKSVQEFYEYLRKVQESFLPNEEYSPRLDYGRKPEQVDRVDLKTLPDKSVVFVKGVHRGADYSIRVDDNRRKVNIWRNMQANGLVGPLESVVSMVEGLTFEEGVIIRGNCQLAMPYFRYKNDYGKKSVEKPTDIWMDVPLIVLVQYAEQH